MRLPNYVGYRHGGGGGLDTNAAEGDSLRSGRGVQSVVVQKNSFVELQAWRKSARLRREIDGQRADPSCNDRVAVRAVAASGAFGKVRRVIGIGVERQVPDVLHRDGLRAVGARAAHVRGSKSQGRCLGPVHLDDSVVDVIGYEEISRCIHRRIERLYPAGHANLAAAAVTADRNFNHRATIANPNVGHEDVAGRVHSNTFHLAPSSADRRLAAADGAAGRNFHDCFEAKVGDEEIACGIHGHTNWTGAGGAVHRSRNAAIRGNFRDKTSGGTSARTEVAEKYIAYSIHGDAQLGVWCSGFAGNQRRVGNQYLFAAAIGAASWNFQHFVQVVIRDEQIAGSIQSQTLRVSESAAERNRCAAACRHLDHRARAGRGARRSVSDVEIARCIDR